MTTLELSAEKILRFMKDNHLPQREMVKKAGVAANMLRAWMKFDQIGTMGAKLRSILLNIGSKDSEKIVEDVNERAD